MVSIKTERCKTPRPKTIHLSALSVSLTSSAKFFSSSLLRRSEIWREVTNLPSLPKNGESLIENNILIVGSSILMVGSGSGFSASQMESPISKPSIPVTAQRSPGWTSVTLARSIPSKTNTSLMRCFSWRPSDLERMIGWFSLMTPLVRRPIAIRPTYEEKSREVMSICVLPSSIDFGGK